VAADAKSHRADAADAFGKHGCGATGRSATEEGLAAKEGSTHCHNCKKRDDDGQEESLIHTRNCRIGGACMHWLLEGGRVPGIEMQEFPPVPETPSAGSCVTMRRLVHRYATCKRLRQQAFSPSARFGVALGQNSVALP
jgi:hypothetical protein